MSDSVASSMRGERTVCPFCSSGCGLYLMGTAGGIEGVGPSEHHPVSGGRLCARGWSAHEATLWGPRVRTPLMRRGGALQPASWEDALEAAARGLRELRDAGRPLGVLTSGRVTNGEAFLAVALARSALRTPHLDSPLRRQWAALLKGLAGAPARLAGSDALPRLERSDLVVLLEGDLATTHPRVALGVLRALRRGADLVTVGWQQTQMSAVATQHIPLDPAAPLATLAGLRASGKLPELLQAARRPSFVLCGFDTDADLLAAAAAQIRELAAGLMEAGVEPLLLPLPIRCNTRGALDMGVAPDCLPGGRPLSDAEARARLVRVWGREGCWDEGLAADALVGAVRGLVVVGEDVPAAHPNPAQARDHLAALEHLVVIDSFLTETAELAHVVLPMAAFGETVGTVTGVEDRAQPFRPFQPAPQGIHQGWDILAELLAALGSSFRPGTLGELRGAVAESVAGYESLTGPQLDDGFTVTSSWTTAQLPGEPGQEMGPALADGPPASHLVLRRVGAFDWGQDSLVRFSPTLRRDATSRSRRFPWGLVEMSAADAAALGVRDGRMLRLKTAHGEARVAVAVHAGVEPGSVLVPYAFREQLGAVLGADGVTQVEVQPA